MRKDFSISEKIANCDQYGSKIELQYKNHKEHITFFGGVITLLNVIILIYSTISYGSELFDKKKPLTIFSEETVMQPETYNLTSKTFTMAFGMQDPNTWNHFIDESVYSIKVI